MNLSIKSKLVYTIMISGTLILLSTVGVYLFFGITNLKKNQIEDVKVLAKVIGENNQAALLFSDSSSARESLYSLHSNNDIEYACIFNTKGDILAESNFINKRISPPKRREDIINKPNLIQVFSDIRFDNESIGKIYVRSNLNQVNKQIRAAIFVGISVILISLLATYIITFMLQRLITKPILRLASVSSEISKNKDYSTKIKLERKDEIGTLVSSFNNMLSEIDLQNKELIESKIKAEHSSKAKELFLANMSHEIRTPINGIDGMTKLLEKTPLNEEQKEYIYAIKTSSENLLVIINDILDFSKIEAGKLTIEKTSFNLKNNLNRTVKSLRYKSEEKGILLETKIDKKISDVLIGDPTRIGQVVINLLNNAIKFTEKGKVELICSLVSSSEETNTIKFEVVDTGIGIEKEKLNYIFESFTQEDDSTTRKFGGTGLGLAICKQLVELFNGELRVKSAKGKGTNFFFTIELPIGESKDLKEEDEEIKFIESLESKHVLLVEDNEINQFLATTILKKWKMKVTVANNGEIAISKLEQENFDIVLMDVQMPVMGGIEATQIIRNKLKLDLPIIALTANAILGDNEKCLEAGMDDYVSKPFDHSTLYNTILKLINKNV